MRTSYSIRLALVFFSILLSGCTTLSVPKKTTHFTYQPWTERKKQLEQIENWHLNGAFSVQQAKSNTIANYYWQQHGQRYDIQIHSALDLYSLQIQGKPHQVILKESQQKTVRAASAEALMQRRLGWSLPIADLTYWIRGLPAPAPQQSKHDRYGHLTQLIQQGWNVHFLRYANVNGYDLPQILQLKGHHLIVKIVVKNWKL